MSHHPGLKLFMISLSGGAVILVIATLTFWALYAHNVKEAATRDELHTYRDVPYDEVNNTSSTIWITGSIEDITEESIRMRVLGMTDVPTEAVLTLLTSQDTLYKRVDSRTPPLPGSGSSVSLNSLDRDALALGDVISTELTLDSRETISTLSPMVIINIQ